MRLGRENVEHELADEPGAVRGEHREADGWGEGELGLDHPQEPDRGRHDQPEHVLDCQCCNVRRSGCGVGAREEGCHDAVGVNELRTAAPTRAWF